MDQVTERSVAPVTSATSRATSPGARRTGFGWIFTVTVVLRVTVTTAVAWSVGSATLCAVTWKVPSEGGAVQKPVPGSKEPPSAAYRTRPSVRPLTVAWNWTVPRGATRAVGGAMAIDRGGATTVATATAVRVGSAWLVATMWKIPAICGAT